MLALSPFQPASSRDIKLSPAQVVAINSIDAEMQTITGKYGRLTAFSDPGDILAYRWLAMAKDYVELGSFASARGLVLARLEQQWRILLLNMDRLTSISDPGDLLAYRWLAMAKQYGH